MTEYKQLRRSRVQVEILSFPQRRPHFTRIRVTVPAFYAFTQRALTSGGAVALSGSFLEAGGGGLFPEICPPRRPISLVANSCAALGHSGLRNG